MSRKYTAEEMREASLWFYYQPNSTGKAKRFDRIEISAILSQAADLMEREEKREKKYEYGVFGRVFSTLNAAMLYAEMNRTRGVRPAVLRREVGDWEEVK